MTNAKSWNLNKGERSILERIEIQTVKYLFDLPSHTPTPAILFTFGILYTGQRVDKKRLIYLHRLLKRYDQHWTKKMLLELDKLKIGWAKEIRENLQSYDLPDDFDTIKATTRRHWVKLVTEKIEIKNKKRLLDDCHKIIDGVKTQKTKTAHIIDELSNDTYRRAPQEYILKCSKQEAKTLIVARFGMLECGRNFKGSAKEVCSTCNAVDNEDHRLNYCPRFKNVNKCDETSKFDFKCIYSNDIHVIQKAIHEIEKVWNVRSAHGTMRV